jgi:hypothetical protein
MVFAFVQVDGHAARAPGTGENSLARRLERLRRKEEPLKTQRLQRLGGVAFSEIFSVRPDEFSSALAVAALLEIVNARHPVADHLGEGPAGPQPWRLSLAA